LNTGLIVKLLGIKVIKKEEALEYLRNYILGKKVYLRFDNDSVSNEGVINAYLYLKNRMFVNAYLIKSGIAEADRTKEYIYKTKFIELEKEVKQCQKNGF
jgi:endonuclease YncB( thermonuclease family)